MSRRLMLLVVLCLIIPASPLFAQHVVNGNSVAISELKVPFSEMMAAHGGGPRRLIKEANVSAEISASIFIFPVVGSTTPRNGFQFRSETTIVNNLNRTQRVALYYFPAAGSGGTPNNCNLGGLVLTMAPLQWLSWPDFVGTVFNASGLGSVIVFGLNSFDNNADATARLDGFSRIYTPLPGTNGQVSQSFPGVTINVAAGTRLYGYGMRQDAGFRTNVGIFNYDFVNNRRRSFDLLVNGIDGNVSFSVDIDPCNLVQFPVPSGTYGIFELSAIARDGGALWYGYGSANDNTTGDNWSTVLH